MEKFEPTESQKEELQDFFEDKEISEYIWEDGENKQGNPIPLKYLLGLTKVGISPNDYAECYRHGKCHYIENCACADNYQETYKEYIAVLEKKIGKYVK